MMSVFQMFYSKKIVTLTLLFFYVCAFSQSATVDLTGHEPSATAPSGSVFEWHSSATPSLGTKLTGTAITAATTSTVYGVYYDATSSCYSPTAKVNVVISACGAGTVDLTGYQTGFTATAFEWHTNSAGTAKVTTPSAVIEGTYFLFDNAGGTLTRLNQVVIVSIIPVPDAPTASVTQPTCTVSNGSVAITSTTTGLTFSTDGTNYATYSTAYTIAAGASYSITAKNPDGCVSLATAGTMGTQPLTPVAPTASLTQPTCTVSNGSVAITSSTTGLTFSTDGTNYATYSTAYTIAAGARYSITAKNSDGCVSSATSGTMGTQPAMPGAPAFAMTQPTCTTATGTVTITGVTDETYSFNGSPYSATLVYSGLAASSINTISAKNATGCISPDATATLNAQPATPAAPTASSQKVCTDGTSNQTLTASASGGTISWYTTAAGGTALTAAPTQIGVGSETYYAENSNGTCSSLTRTTVSLTIDPALAAPVASITTQPTSCAANTGTVEVSEPVGTEYTYSLDGVTYQPGVIFSGVSIGSHTLTVKTSTCTSPGTIVTVNSVPFPIIN